MLRLRPYKACDAAAITKWIKSEYAFRQWSADRYEHYPITSDDMIRIMTRIKIFVDGIHIGKFADKLQKFMDESCW